MFKPSPQLNETSSVRFKMACLSCAKGTLIIVSSGVCALALLGYGVEHHVSVGEFLAGAWAGLMHWVSWGGEFWGAAATAVVGVALLTWSVCVSDSMDKDLKRRYEQRVMAAGMLGALIWVLAAFSMMYVTSNPNFRFANHYMAIAMFFTIAPLGATGFVVLVKMWQLMR